MPQVYDTPLATAVKTSLFNKKKNFYSFKLFLGYYKSLTLSKVGESIEEKNSSSFVYVVNKT